MYICQLYHYTMFMLIAFSLLVYYVKNTKHYKWHVVGSHFIFVELVNIFPYLLIWVSIVIHRSDERQNYQIPIQWGKLPCEDTMRQKIIWRQLLFFLLHTVPHTYMITCVWARISTFPLWVLVPDIECVRERLPASPHSGWSPNSEVALLTVRDWFHTKS